MGRPRRALVRPAALALAFALGMAASFVTGWLALERPLTPSTAKAACFIAMAAALAAGGALPAVAWLRRRPWSARFAAAFAILTVGTVAGASLLIAVERIFVSHPLGEAPLEIVLLVLAIVGAGSLYAFLSIAAYLMLPLGLPIIVATALLVAGRR
jgi:hypothetical protein